MNKDYYRKKRTFVIKRLKDLSILPVSEPMSIEQQIIHDKIYNGDFSFWEEIKEKNGWTEKPKLTYDEIVLREKRRKIRNYFRTKNVLPPYNSPMNDEQKEIFQQIENNDFSFYEKYVNDRKKEKIQIIKSSNKVNTVHKNSTDKYVKANSLPKMVFHRLRIIGILPNVGEELNEEQKDIVNDVNENWENKPKNYFIKKYLHLTTPEGRLLYRLYKSHQDFGFNFNLTIEDIVIPERCPLLNVVLLTDPKFKDHPHYYTGDRIDSSKGLIKGNIQVISLQANRMKSKSTENELLLFATNALKLLSNE